MKRLLSAAVLGVLLLLCAPAEAQVYPDWMKGVQSVDGVEVNAFLVEALYFPYSLPDPPDELAWLGNLIGHGDYISWYVMCLHRWPIGQCLTDPLPGYGSGKNIEWNPVAECYLHMEVLPGGTIAFESITVHSFGEATWAIGCFDLVPGHPIPTAVVDDSCPFMRYEIHQAPQARIWALPEVE